MQNKNSNIWKPVSKWLQNFQRTAKTSPKHDRVHYRRVQEAIGQTPSEDPRPTKNPWVSTVLFSRNQLDPGPTQAARQTSTAGRSLHQWTP